MIKSDDYLRDLVTIFFIQKRIIFWVTFLVTAAAVAIYIFWPRTYGVNSSILVKRNVVQKSPDTIEDTFTSVRQVGQDDLMHEIAMLTSYDVIARSIEGLNDAGEAFTEQPLDETRLKTLIMSVKSSLETNPIPESNIINVQYKSRDSQKAILILDELLRNYIQYRSEIISPIQIEPFYKGQAEKFDREILELEAKVVQLTEESKSANPEMEISNNIATKQSIEQMLVVTENTLIEKRRLVDHFTDSLNSKAIKFYSSLENRSISDLAFKLQDLYIELGNITRVYTSDNVKAKRVQEQIDDTSRLLKQEVASYVANQKNELRTAEEQIENMRSRLNAIEDRNIQLQSFLIQRQRVEREMELLKQSYSTFSLREKEAGVSQSSEKQALFSISLLNSPFFSGQAIFPTQKIIPVGLFVGFIAGCCLGFIREFFDHTIKTPEDVGRFSEMSTIFSIPNGR